MEELTCRNIGQLDDNWGYSYVPSVYARLKRPKREKGYYIFRTNKQGFPSDFDFMESKINKKRILFFGDSNLVATGVKNNQRFCDVIGDTRNDLECYSFGLGSSGFTEQYLIYDQVRKIYEHDVIFFCPHIVDISRFGIYRTFIDNITGNYIKIPKPNFILNEHGELLLQNFPVNYEQKFNSIDNHFSKIKKQSGYSKKIKDFLFIHLTRESDTPLFLKEKLLRLKRTRGNYSLWKKNSYHYKLVKAIMERQIALARGKKVVLCPLPYPKLGNYPNYQPLFYNLEEDHENVFFIDLGKEIARLTRKQRWDLVFEKDNHYNIRGHKFLAESILNYPHLEI